MKLIRFKLSIICFLLQGCATNDSNSSLVRFLNDGFVYTDKRSSANEVCSEKVAQERKVREMDENEIYQVYRNCMKKKGY
ncbi:hypothetical protein SKM54_03635 [Acinetobacter faecalis]|uniref:hypothetical protein n=1 Tax=Acinetobacter faecalis TaxID=2665161 RepID=UPI002A90A62C|nr:hypothetical protein [Acinetobacter faecalis]MDY6451137.1 hypothetical protein [Acinetobacter faecalis]MDY6481538.1 hypothetical protein [Acinetobacter faecalis]